jgi:hypothetical protein
VLTVTVTLCVPLMASKCPSTTQISSETLDRIVCETADFYRFKPYRSTFEKLTPEEQADLRSKLAAYRKQRCPEILKGKLT